MIVRDRRWWTSHAFLLTALLVGYLAMAWALGIPPFAARGLPAVITRTEPSALPRREAYPLGFQAGLNGEVAPIYPDDLDREEFARGWRDGALKCLLMDMNRRTAAGK